MIPLAEKPPSWWFFSFNDRKSPWQITCSKLGECQCYVQKNELWLSWCRMFVTYCSCVLLHLYALGESRNFAVLNIVGGLWIPFRLLSRERCEAIFHLRKRNIFKSASWDGIFWFPGGYSFPSPVRSIFCSKLKSCWSGAFFVLVIRRIARIFEREPPCHAMVFTGPWCQYTGNGAGGCTPFEI